MWAASQEQRDADALPWSTVGLGGARGMGMNDLGNRG